MLPRFDNAFEGPQFERDSGSISALEVIRWWESRRLFFNTAVGLTGVLTCALMILCAFIAEPIVGEAIGLPDGPVLGVGAIVVYGILANVFYTGGWVCELLVRRRKTREGSAAFAVIAFRWGVKFSVLLTLCPAIFCWVVFAIALLRGEDTLRRESDRV